ncbi:MAG: L-threonylcarbamoyladenylate synthase [Planctomycetota bacterium]|nr:L-threonylcarbamoyladenylate synthase [Planctomycetota bacterium]
MTRICDIGKDVSRAAKLLREGGVVAFGTETVYGLGANAFDPRAVARVFEVKRRPTFDPLIVHVADREQLVDLVASIPSQAELLMDRFWPGPLTVILPKTDRVPDLVTSGLDTVAVRIPGHAQAIQLLREAGVPVAAPSANPFGLISPTLAEHVASQLGTLIDYILDGGPCDVGLESTVVAVTESETSVLRLGGVPVEEIEAVIGSVSIGHTPGAVEVESTTARRAPGMLARHYAPQTPLRIVHEADPATFDGNFRVGLLTAFPTPHADRFATVEVLSHARDLRESAANFCAALRRLDAAGLDEIAAFRFPDEGLGRALNDRLKRAAVCRG